MRVYELAKKLQIDSKDLIDILKKLKIDVKSHMSGISEEDIKKVNTHLKKEKDKKKEKPKKKAEKKTTKKVDKKKPDKRKVEKKEEKPEKKKPVKKEDKKKERKPRKKKEKKPEKKKKDVEEKPKKKRVKKEKILGEVEVNGRMTVYELSKLLKVSSDEIIRKLLTLGEDVENIASLLTYDVASAVGSEYGLLLKLPDGETIETKFPVIAFLGHVDHGKTSLLDAIRKTSFVSMESGGITQHIGVSEIDVDGTRLSLLDTPGHRAFTAMRARGARVTDIVVLVVAADDGVMPQTIEALNHAKAAGVEIIVALNKIDTPGANPASVVMELAKYEIIPDDQGGENQFFNVSATENIGIKELIDGIVVQGEMLELKGYPERRVVGVVIETQLDKSRGPVATILIQEGTLKIGDKFMIGAIDGKVRAMTDYLGERVESAGPSKAVEIMGLNDLPNAGDIMITAERDVLEELTEFLKEKNRLAEISTPRVSLDDWFSQLQDGEQKELNVIVKGDVYGSSEVINDVIGSIGTDGVRVNVIHFGVGMITENDILLAGASDAIVIGFGVGMDKMAVEAKNKIGVDVKTYDIIYDLIEDIEKAIEGMLEPEVKDVLIGRVEVRQIFETSNSRKIAGSFIKEGKVVRGAKAKLMRGEEEIYSGKIDTLRRFESDVKEVKKGYECGITLENHTDLQEGDIILIYQEKRIKKEFKIDE